MKRFFIVMLLGVALMGSRCNPDGCTIEDSRCNGTVVETCDGEQNWIPWIDCDGVDDDSGQEYVCCLDPEDATYSCLPQEECGEPQETDGTD